MFAVMAQMRKLPVVRRESDESVNIECNLMRYGAQQWHPEGGSPQALNGDIVHTDNCRRGTPLGPCSERLLALGSVSRRKYPTVATIVTLSPVLRAHK